MFNHMIGNITKIRLRSYICASSDGFLPSISSLRHWIEIVQTEIMKEIENGINVMFVYGINVEVSFCLSS